MEAPKGDSIAKNIARVRRKRGLTQRELASRIGTAQQQLSQWESGHRVPKIETILKISNALSCNPKEICPVFDDNGKSICSADDVFRELKIRAENAMLIEKESRESGWYQKASEAHGAFLELSDILNYFEQRL